MSYTWDPNKKSTYFTLSNGDLTATVSTGSYRIVIGTDVLTGKKYWEVVPTSLGGTCLIGITNIPPPSYDGYYVGQYHKSAGWWNINNKVYLNGSGTLITGTPNYTANDVLMFAYDADAGNLWVGLNGTWHNNGDPANGTNPTITDVQSGFAAYEMYVGLASNYADESFDLHTTTESLSYTPPNGFSTLTESGQAASGQGYQTSYASAAAEQKQPASGHGYQTSYASADVEQKQPAFGQGYQESYPLGAAAQKQPGSGTGYQDSYASGEAVQSQPAAGQGFQYSYSASSAAQLQPASGSGYSTSYADGFAAQAQPAIGGGFQETYGTGSAEAGGQPGEEASGGGYQSSYAEGAGAQIQPVSGAGQTTSYAAGVTANIQPASGGGYAATYGAGNLTIVMLPEIERTLTAVRRELHGTVATMDRYSGKISADRYSTTVN